MPDNLYFREPGTQSMLLDVLFIWVKLNPDIGYRQGMHEVMAILLWVVQRDAIDTSIASSHDSLMLSLFDSRFICHDAFTLFGLVMQELKSAYDPGTEPARSEADGTERHGIQPPVIARCKLIMNDYLAKTDPALAAHLHDIAIVPQVFLL